MNLKELNEWFGLVAHFGVILGIIFLAVEINQNSQTVRSQTRSDIANSISDVMLRAAFSDYVDVTLDSVDLDSLDEAEERRVLFYQFARFRLWENFHYQYRNGLFDEAEYVRERAVWSANLEIPVVRSAFCAVRSFHSEAFVTELESLMSSAC